MWLSKFFTDAAGGFSTRKFWAFIFCWMAVVEKFKLVFFSRWHFSVALHNAGVSDAVIITLITSMDAMALGALMVYGWKENVAAANSSTEKPVTPGDVK
jgi:hypothetical protein